MAVTTKTLHGARVWLYGPDTKDALGVFESVDTGSAYEHFEPYILGRVSAGEVVLTALQPISIRLGGFRKIDEGPYTARVGMLKLQDFHLNDQEFTCVLVDRVTSKSVMQVIGCKIVGQNFSVAARNPARLSLEIVGLRFSDEEGIQDEPVNSAVY